MNYSEYNIEENKKEISKITKTEAKEILNDFEILNKNLEEYKVKIEELQINKINFDNYILNLQNNHLNTMNIINNFNIYENNKELNEIFINYNLKIKENYNKWIKEYYTIKLLEYENTIEIIEEKISEFRELFIYIINKIKKTEIENKKLCPICFENEVDICLNPCGHTICNKCVIINRNRFTSEKCYSCRGVINEYIKIYFSL